MKLLALMKAPPNAEEVAQWMAQTLGIAPAEARLRLAPEPPALLGALPDERADELARKLEERGCRALTCALPVPDDKDRVLTRTLELAPDAVTFSPRQGPGLRLPYQEIAVLLRGQRVTQLDVTAVEKVRKFSLTNAVLTQGVKMTTTVQKEVRTTQEESEHFVLVYGRDGACAALYDRQVAFASLGSKVQPTRLGNINLIATELRAKAPGAYFDDRLLRLGRRKLPFVVPRESRASAGSTQVVRSDTTSSVDVVAEFLAQAARRGLLA